jgi:hypothetical protein
MVVAPASSAPAAAFTTTAVATAGVLATATATTTARLMGVDVASGGGGNENEGEDARMSLVDLQGLALAKGKRYLELVEQLRLNRALAGKPKLANQQMATTTAVGAASTGVVGAAAAGGGGGGGRRDSDTTLALLPPPFPPRRRCHWDVVCEEVAWLATDMCEERRWKVAAAATCSLALRSNFEALRKKRAEDHEVSGWHAYHIKNKIYLV